MFLKLPKLVSRRAMVMVYLLFCVTLLKENIEDFDCTREELNDPLELMQFTFTENLNRAKADFVGREWLFKNLTNFLEKNNKESKGMHLIGAPGFGKSAFMSQLVCSKLSSYSIHSQILGYHMCIHSHKNTQNPAKFVQNLAALISSRVPEYRDLILTNRLTVKVLKDDCGSDPTGCFNEVILFPLSKLQLRFVKPMYIMIDALDECFDEKNDLDKETTIVNILSQSLQSFPSWLKVIVTSRNMPEIRRHLASLDMIELRPDDPRNLRDIERFIAMKTKQPDIQDFPISTLVNKSQGNFLFIKLVLEHIEAKDFKLDKLSSLPHSISSVYQNFFKRKYKTDEKFRAPRRMFEVLVAALSPLTADELYQVLLMENKDFDYEYDFMPMLEDLYTYLSYSPGTNGVVSVFHSSLTEWLVSRPNRGGRFYVDEKRGHRLLAEYYIHKIQELSTNVTTQFLFHLATYIVNGGRLKRHVNHFKELDQKIVNTVDRSTNATVLHHAAGSSSIEILSLILQFFVKVDCADIYNRTPVFYSVLFGRLDNLRLLHEKGASLFLKTHKHKIQSSMEIHDCKRQMCGYSLLQVASQKGHKEIAQYLLENNVNISSKSGTGDKAIHLAAEFGQIETMKTLMKHGAPLDNMCLYYGASRGQRHVVQFLLDHGVEDTCVDCRNHFLLEKLSRSYMRFCNTALHAAAIHDFPDVVTALLASNDSATNCTNYYGNEPVHETVHHNNFRSLEVFLEHGTNLSKTCKFTPAHSNLSHGVDFCLCGFTPLHIAVYHGFPAITHLLLEYNASYNATNCDGLRPVHVASCRGQLDVLSILVEHGADINSKSLAGLTPIHYACKCRAIKSFQKLFALGADGLAVSPDNQTAWDFILTAAEVVITDSYFIDPYVDRPIDPVSYESSTRSQGLDHMDDYLFPALIQFLEGFVKTNNNISSFDNIMDLIREAVVQNKSSTMWMDRLVGNSERSDYVVVAPISPPFLFILDMATTPFIQKYFLHYLGKNSVIPSVLKTTFQKILLNQDCSLLLKNVKNIMIYRTDALLDLGMDVNCEESGLSPILVYLRQGSRNMAKVLVKHGVTIDIKCGEDFEDSVFHLAAYHKLHYLQYLSVFQDSDKWEDYIWTKDAIFDYLFDEYEKTTHEGQVRVTRVRDGPVTKAIKSHLRGFKIIDECLDDEGYTALHRAAQGGNVVAVIHFLNWGANVNMESPGGFDLLTLCIFYAVKYRPRLNFHKPSLLTGLETELASLTANVILEHLTKDNQLDIRCDHKRKAPTLLHLAATRGMWRFINDLFITKDKFKVIGLNANCSIKHGITPMYLAKVYGGEDCEWDNPWCKVVGVLLQHGASEILPERVTEYFVIFNFLFNDIPKPLDLELSKNEIAFLQDSGLHDECSSISHVEVLLPQDNSYVQSDWEFITRLDEAKSQHNKLFNAFMVFLNFEIITLKVGFSILKNIEDSTLRCVSRNVPKHPELTDRSDTTTSNTRSFEAGGYKEDTIIFTAYTIYNPDLDLCSHEVTEQLNRVEGAIQHNRRSLKANYRIFRKEMERIGAYYKKYLSKREPAKQFVKVFGAYEKDHTCHIWRAAYSYTQLKYLLHTMKFWNEQVRKSSIYRSISKYVSQRMQDIILGEDQAQMTRFILELAQDKYWSNHQYLKMLRFTKPPMFKKTMVDE